MNGQDPQNPQQPSGQQGGTQPTPPQHPRPSDAELGIGSTGDFATSIKIPPHSLKFDELYFLKLLAGSISLMKEEKMKIVEAVPKLTQFQVDELIRILEDERRKFAELDDKHQAKVKELQQRQEEEWKQLETKKEEELNKTKALDEAEKLRQQIAQGGSQQK